MFFCKPHCWWKNMCMCMWRFSLQFKLRVNLQKMLIENSIHWLKFPMSMITLVQFVYDLVDDWHPIFIIPYAILGELFQGMAKTLAMKEKGISLIKWKIKVWISHGMWDDCVLHEKCMRFRGSCYVSHGMFYVHSSIEIITMYIMLCWQMFEGIIQGSWCWLETVFG